MKEAEEEEAGRLKLVLLRTIGAIAADSVAVYTDPRSDLALTLDLIIVSLGSKNKICDMKK